VSGRRILLWVLRLGLAGVYVFAAIPKILDPWDFSRAIWNFRILPLFVIPPIALWLPVLEGLAALAVLVGLFHRGGLVVLNLLSALFAIGIASAIARGLDIDCGCFGDAATSEANLSHLGLNLVLLAAGIVLLIDAQRRRGRPQSHG
jgi:hypothetical protein